MQTQNYYSVDVGLRSFEFQWQMSPRNELEANVRMIIRAFKQWSAPRKLAKIDSGWRRFKVTLVFSLILLRNS